MTAFLIAIHVIICIFLIISILLQSSKGGGLAGMFGGGGMGGVFGGRGAATFLSKVTLWLGVAFAVTSVSIALFSGRNQNQPRSMIEQVMEQEQTALPATPGNILPTAVGDEETAPAPTPVPDGQGSQEETKEPSGE